MLTKIAVPQETWARELIRVFVGVILLFACSQLFIPIEPVPISLQTMGLMVIAVLYDLRSGMYATLAYIAMGALGAPVFVGYRFGIAVLMGTTGGYFVGFIACIYVMNKLKALLDMGTVYGIFVNCVAGTVVIFICGLTWLSYMIGFQEAIIHGLLPFIIPGIAKAIMLTAFLRSVHAVRGW